MNWKGRTALHCAAIANRPLSVSLLLLHGARKDVLSKDRVTAVEDADLRSHERCKGPSMCDVRKISGFILYEPPPSFCPQNLFCLLSIIFGYFWTL